MGLIKRDKAWYSLAARHISKARRRNDGNKADKLEQRQTSQLPSQNFLRDLSRIDDAEHYTHKSGANRPKATSGENIPTVKQR